VLPLQATQSGNTEANLTHKLASVYLRSIALHGFVPHSGMRFSNWVSGSPFNATTHHTRG
jgi:hypothetical protein